MQAPTRPAARSRLAAIGELVRARYAPGQAGVLDVERMVEIGLGLEIVPRRGVLEHTNKPGWLGCDGRTIVVDADFQLTHEAEYRSFLAHEAAHHLLHRGLIPWPRPKTAAACATFYDAMSEATIAVLEWEARTLAAFLQMPTPELRVIFWDAYELALDRFPRVSGPAKTFVHLAIARHFGVSPVRAEVRAEGMWRAAARLERGAQVRHATGLHATGLHPEPAVRMPG